MRRSTLPIIFLIVMLDVIGIGIIVPVYAPMLLRETYHVLPVGTPFAARTMILGLLIATFTIAQFFGAPILGALADRYGRKPILLISILGTCIGYLLSGLGVVLGHIGLLFVSRLLDGFTGGNISVANSAIADVSEGKAKAKNFGLIGMAFGVGFIIGPFLGGVLSDSSVVSWFTLSTPFWFAALLSVINMVLVWLLFPETIRKKIHAPISVFTGMRNVGKALRMPNMRTMFLVVFFFMFGFTSFTQFFQVFLIERFQYTQSQIGNLFAFMGLCIALVQGTVVRIVGKRVAPHRVLRFSLLALACVMPLLIIPHDSRYMFAIIPLIAFCNGLTFPNTTATISGQADAASQGEIMGINQSVQALAQSIPPIISGMVAAVHVTLPIMLASIMIFVAWLIFVTSFHPRAIEPFHEAA